MKNIKQKAKETRKDYLIRVTIAYLKENGCAEICYDGAEYDCSYLIEDLETEFNQK